MILPRPVWYLGLAGIETEKVIYDMGNSFLPRKVHENPASILV